jgi:hypothetical protein
MMRSTLVIKKDLLAISSDEKIQKIQQALCQLDELMRFPSAWNSSVKTPKITMILNHFKRKTICAQLESLMHQNTPFHKIWVLAFGSPNENS